MKTKLMLISVMGTFLCLSASAASLPDNGSVLPFPPTPMSASVAKPRLQDSVMKWPQQPQRLPTNAPNILVILIDDAGFGVADTFGGEIHTPTLTRLAKNGLMYNDLNDAAICSPTRAQLLTGRNPTRVGSGTIAERAVAFDGYTGIMPRSGVTMAEVLKDYGYHTAAFGKWHNTPAIETSAIGPKSHWPNAYGFEYFYGFLGGETSQYEPRLFQNYDPIEPPHEPGYYLTKDLTDKALAWLDELRAFDPKKPFFMYWAPGAVHGPQQVAKEWADKYKGKFDDGWDAYREKVYQHQLAMGIIPPGTKLTPRDPTMQGWADIPQDQRAFQSRLMEVFAGFVEQTDTQVGRLIDGLKQRGMLDNTIVIYVFGDNGSSAEGQQGSISELLAQNNIPNTVGQQIAALDKIGGLDALGTYKTDNMYHAGWAWAGDTPFRSTKLVAAHFGGTRNPMVISWPDGIKPSQTIRPQFLDVNDVVPTIYQILGITPPKVVNGVKQTKFDGTSFAYTFTNAGTASQHTEQFFDNNGSRALYQDGWVACTFGPLIPWDTAGSAKQLTTWDSAKDKWELYHVTDDFSEANNLAGAMPEKLTTMKKEFLRLAAINEDFPIGAGNWLRLHPEDRIKSDYTHWTFTQQTRRMPEFAAPGLGRESNKVEMEVDVPKNANGVLYALGGAGGGLTLYLDQNHLVYLYNMMIIEQYTARSAEPITPGKHKIEVITDIAGPGKAGTATLLVDGQEVGKAALKRTVPAAFTATETFDVGADLGSVVSLDYYDRRPFEFNGKITKFTVTLD